MSAVLASNLLILIGGQRRDRTADAGLSGLASAAMDVDASNGSTSEIADLLVRIQPGSATSLPADRCRYMPAIISLMDYARWLDPRSSSQLPFDLLWQNPEGLEGDGDGQHKETNPPPLFVPATG